MSSFEKQLDSIIKMLPIAIFWKDVDLVYKGGNDLFAKLLGYEKVEEIIGLTDDDVYGDKESVSLYKSDDESVINTGESLMNYEEIFFNRKMGKEVCWKISKMPLLDENEKICGVIATCEDITSKKLENNELNKLRGEVKKSEKFTKSFVSNITHSIRTPLSAIMGFTDMIVNKDIAPEDIVAFTGMLQYNADRLNKVISDTLDIASVESGELKVKSEVIELKSFIEEEIGQYKDRVRDSDKSHISIKAITGDDELFVMADKVRLKQVLSNLIGNALKFTEVGGVTVGYRVDNKKCVLLYITDTGAGIEEEKLGLIFERFRQGSSVIEDVNSGLGLGLSISKELVNQMGGEIWVESRLGNGSTFNFTLSRGGSSESEPSEEIEWDSKWNNMTILLADDVIYAHQFIKALLKPHHIEIISAMDGIEAVEIMESNKDVNLILMDIQMPRMDGVEAMMKIKEDNPDIPIVAYTAYAMSGDRDLYLKKGFDDYLSKPLEVEELIQVFKKSF
jgi:PAS domain S-box-containing protein